jgi:hypothetical protein
MLNLIKLAPVLLLAFVALAFIPNVLTDRRDKQEVRDFTSTTVKTGASLTGRLWGFLKGEWLANHEPTILPEDKIASSDPSVFVIASDGKGGFSVTEKK